MVSQTNSPKEAHEMLSTKIRTTIIALVASAGLAATSAPLTPVASASKNTGGYQKTVGKVKAWQNTCANAQISFENALTMAEVDKTSGDLNSRDQDLKLAETIMNNGRASGCAM
jgi:hypothetical protein